MKFLKFLLKFAFVFTLVFILYTFIYHYKVNSEKQISISNTFLASEEDINEISSQDGSGYGVGNENLSEENINKDGFYIRIDEIDLFKPVVKNVDPRYKEVYVESWKTGVSHGKFTALPDQIGNVYFYAHAVSDVSRLESENAWFTRTDELVEGDDIIVYYSGKKYTYQVSRIYTVSPSATGVYTGVSPVPKVTLQTCGPPRGSLSSRYMVEALQISAVDF
jgi:LPXTG-site transpeptidase (sortase) family protein